MNGAPFFLPADMVVQTEADARQNARDIQRMSNRSLSSSNQVYAFEVRFGSRKFYSVSLMKPAESEGHSRLQDPASHTSD